MQINYTSCPDCNEIMYFVTVPNARWHWFCPSCKTTQPISLNQLVELFVDMSSPVQIGAIEAMTRIVSDMLTTEMRGGDTFALVNITEDEDES